MNDLARKMFLGEHAVEARPLPYALADCPTCGEPAINPRTGECFACADERDEP
ncbi:MAG TPA: hypothetical protein VEA38_08825 [Terriglobales bacterium]|nr:hypothetical protein [Terriglobales bacterium]